MRMIRTRVPDETYAALATDALRAGVTLAEHVRLLLVTATATEPVSAASDTARTPVDPARLDSAVRWMQDQGLRKPVAIKTKTALLAWCEAQGFE